MVQLSPSPTLDASPPPERSREDNERGPSFISRSPKMSSTGTIQLTFEVSTVYQGYETYIEDGLICLKHKIRNMEKKKLKLEDYKQRLKLGETLNKDQMGAVTKYEELLHNLAFAQEMHKTLDSLTQNLLRAQKKAAKRDQMAKVDNERRRLILVLKVQHLLFSLQQDHVRQDLLAGLNNAPHVPALRLHSLTQLASLLGAKRNHRLSLEEQMGQAALLYLDLLEGMDKPVAGSTFKLMKEELTRLLHCDYFNNLPPPPSKTLEASLSLTSHATLPKTKEVSKEEFVNRLYQTDMATVPASPNWKAEFQAMKGKEPPDSWDMELTEVPACPQPTVCKPWRGAATFVPKVPVPKVPVPKVAVDNKKQSVTTKWRKERKAKGLQNGKSATCIDTPEVFNSPSALPKDPILRKQHLEDLMTKIHGSFSFMQDSLLDGDMTTNCHPRRVRQSSGSPSPLAQRESTRSPINILPKVMHSTPLPPRCMEHKPSLTNGEPSLGTLDLNLSEVLAHEPLQLSDGEAFPSPPLYQRESISVNLEEKNHTQTPVSESGKRSPCKRTAPCTSTPPQVQAFSTPPTRLALSSTPFQNLHSMFKVNTPLPPNMDYKPGTTVFSDMGYSTASTQTPPEFAPTEDELQPVLQSEYPASSEHSYLSPSQSNGSAGRSGQSYYRGSMRGMARGGKGLAHSFRSSGWHRGGPYMSHLREPGLLFYGNRDHVYQHRRGGLGAPRRSSSGWSDSSQVSSPDREGTFPLVDSAHGDSLSVSTLEIPVTPHPHHATLLPMQLYPMAAPMRVAFTASRTANFAPGNLDQPVVFDQLHSNLGEMYDAHVGRFTCPANGTYVFLFHILKLAVNVPLYVNLMRNDEVMVSAYANDGAPDHETASNHAILPLYQGDQVWLRLHRGAIYGSTWKYSTFSGFLLYQD